MRAHAEWVQTAVQLHGCSVYHMYCIVMTVVNMLGSWKVYGLVIIYLSGMLSRVTVQRYHCFLPCSPMSH